MRFDNNTSYHLVNRGPNCAAAGNLGPDSIYRCRLTSIGIPMLKIRRSLPWKSPYLGKTVFILRQGPGRLQAMVLFAAWHGHYNPTKYARMQCVTIIGVVKNKMEYKYCIHRRNLPRCCVCQWYPYSSIYIQAAWSYKWAVLLPVDDVVGGKG